MKTSNVRKGITQAKINEEVYMYYLVESLIVCVITGLYFKSWWVFGGAFCFFFLGIHMRFVPLIIATFFSIIWAFIGACIVGAFYSEELKERNANHDVLFKDLNFWEITVIIFDIFTISSASIVVSLIILSGALGIHLSGIEYLRDLNDDEDRNMGF